MGIQATHARRQLSAFAAASLLLRGYRKPKVTQLEMPDSLHTGWLEWRVPWRVQRNDIKSFGIMVCPGFNR